MALYDENMKRVMMVLFGDSRSGSERGYFNVYFYPQDSSYGYRSSSYIYSSFRKTAELWWGPFQGGHGAVYATIDGQSYGYPIAECDNSSRVIKYMAVLGYCYSSHDVVEMRVHDIRVVADLSRHDPTASVSDEPEPYDGTHEGKADAGPRRILSIASQNRADNALNEGATAPQPYWTGPWPLLHIPVQIMEGSAFIVFTISIDLLANVAVESVDVGLSIEDGVSDTVIAALVDGIMAELSSAWGGQIGTFALALRLSLIGLDIACTYSPPVAPAFLALAASYAAWLLLFAGWVYIVMAAVDDGYMTPGAAAASFFVFGTSLLRFMGMGLVSQCRTAREFWRAYQVASSKMWRKTVGAQFLLTVTTIIVKVAVFVTCMILFLYYFQLHVMLYGW